MAAQPESSDRKKRKSFKRVRWIAFCLGVLIMVLGAGLLVYDRMADRILAALADQAVQDVSHSQHISSARSSGQNEPQPFGSKQRGKPDRGTADDRATDNKAQRPGGTDVAQSSDRAVDSSKPSGERGKKGDAGLGKASPSRAEDYNPELTPKEAERAKAKVTYEEKLRLAYILLGHWSVKDLKALQSSLKDGLTLDEKRELKRKMLSEFSQEEYDEIIQIAEKYGLSQGKSYEESLRE